MHELRVPVVIFALILTPACGGESGAAGGDGGAGEGGPGGMDAGAADGGGTVLPDGRVISPDGATALDAGASPDGGTTVLPDGRVILPDGGPAGMIPCQGKVYRCGDTMDNDGDGLTDDQDPDCLGPCDNNERGYDLNIPGGGEAPCRLECYFDQDTGRGNDECDWDLRCDELRTDEAVSECAYEPPATRPGAARCPASQTEQCQDFCGPLVPNGCDCFGCCNLPAGGDTWVFIGAEDAEGNGTCTPDTVDDPSACPRCNPVMAEGCFNPCGECELCLGRTELPASCRPDPVPDGGVPPADGGAAGVGGVPSDGGSTPTPVPTCDEGFQACGVEGLPPCPEGYFCLTGCCYFFG